MTEWDEFRELELKKVKKLLKTPCMFDLRGIFEPGLMAELGFKYVSVGR